MGILNELSLSEVVIFAALIFVVILQFIFIIIINNKCKRLSFRLDKIMSGFSDDSNIDDVIDDIKYRLDSFEESNKVNDIRINNLEKEIFLCVKNIAVVRYNAFEKMGSDQSFSVALLDANGDGVVITGLYSRDSSYTYAKPIKNYLSNYYLTDEENMAITAAINNRKKE